MFPTCRIFRVQLISGLCMAILSTFFHLSFLCFAESLKVLNISHFSVLNANLSPVEHFKLMSIVNAIPRQWKLIIRQSTQHITSYISDMIYLKMGNFDEVALSEVSSKKLYEAFRNKKQVPPTAQTKLEEKFPHLSVDWKEIYSLPFTVTIETKILDNIIFKNQKLFQLKMIKSPLCIFCKRETESPNICSSIVM